MVLVSTFCPFKMGNGLSLSQCRSGMSQNATKFKEIKLMGLNHVHKKETIRMWQWNNSP